jgi:DNA repair protein RadC
LSKPPSNPSPLRCLRDGRCAYAPRTRWVTLTTPTDVVDFARHHYPPDLDREAFSIILVGARNQILRLLVVSIGTLTASLVHPREVFRPAIRHGAVSLILVHNHPSGDPEPSADDLALTKRLVKAGELLGIEILDHLILAGSQFRSLKNQGAL